MNTELVLTLLQSNELFSLKSNLDIYCRWLVARFICEKEGTAKDVLACGWSKSGSEVCDSPSGSSLQHIVLNFCDA